MSEDLGALLSECAVIYIMRYMTGSEQDGMRIGFPLTSSVGLSGHLTPGKPISLLQMESFRTL